TVSMVLRTNGSPAALSQGVRNLIRSLDARLPVSRMEPLDALVSRALAKERFNTLLLTIFGLTALLLASVGLYGVMAYLVSQRTREIGIRLALGGEPSSIRRMVLREGFVIAVGGLVVGGIVS